MRPPRPPAPLDRAGLERHLLWYLERYEGSARRVLDVLRRKIRRAAQAGMVDPVEAEGWARELVATAVEGKLVDDARVAESTVRNQRLRGKPTNAIRGALFVRGIPEKTASVALAADEEDDATAIVRFARRKGFGPWRRGELTPEREKKELGSMVRAGFSYDYARRVMRATSDEDLEEAVRGR